MVVDPPTPTAGLPTPGAGQQHTTLDDLCVQNVATFFARAQGHSMEPEIHNGDLLIIDRSRNAAPGKTCVFVLEGGLCVKQYHPQVGQVELRSVNPDYPPIKVLPDQDLEIWGVVTHSLRQFR